MPSISEFASFSAEAEGWLPDETVRTTQANALLAKVYAAGGGTIFLSSSSGKYRADGQLFIPNNGASPQPKQPTVRFIGEGCGPNWWDTSSARQPPLGPSILDLRYTASDGNAKIETWGLGTLALENLTIIDGGSSNATPFLHTTNTTLLVDAVSFVGSGSATQDAIVLGGPTSVTLGGAVGSPFQGYGTVIDRCAFIKLNRGVYGRTFANAVVIRDCTWPYGATGTRAIEFDGASSGAGVYGAVITGNVFEMTHYVYGIYGSFFARSLIVGNGFYDGAGAGSNRLFDVYFSDSDCTSNTVIRAYDDGPATAVGGDSSAVESTLILGGLGGMKTAAGNSFSAALQIQETTNPPDSPKNGQVWYDGTDYKFRTGGAWKTVTLT